MFLFVSIEKLIRNIEIVETNLKDEMECSVILKNLRRIEDIFI